MKLSDPFIALWQRGHPGAGQAAASDQPGVPRILWSLWLQGWDEAPDLVRACAASWGRHNPTWDVRRLTGHDLREMLPPESTVFRLLAMDAPPEAVSNLVRLELLARWGGVWADATTYCLRPLDDWLAPVTRSGFFAFDRPGPDRMLSNWFLAAPAASPVILRWQALSEDYWAERDERDEYFWMHRLFRVAYETDPGVRATWDTAPKLSAVAPHAFTPYQATLYGPVTPRTKKVALGALTPLLKLTHKLEPVAEDAGTLYRWLCERELGERGTTQGMGPRTRTARAP